MTSAVAAWLWRRGARALAPEVGLDPVAGLTTPQAARWRCDLAATVVVKAVESVHVVEVKGTREDLEREDLSAGKWLCDWHKHAINPWIAVDDRIGAGSYRDLGPHWGVLVVSGHRVNVVRRPPEASGDYHQPSDDVTRAYRAIAEVVTAQRLPTMMGLKAEEAAQLIADGTFTRPWAAWTDIAVTDSEPLVDEDAKIL